MTPEELRTARHKLDLSIDEFCRAFGVANSRTVRGWELGYRGEDRIPAPVPAPVSLLVRLALKFENVRQFLGIPEQRNPSIGPDE